MMEKRRPAPTVLLFSVLTLAAFLAPVAAERMRRSYTSLPALLYGAFPELMAHIFPNAPLYALTALAALVTAFGALSYLRLGDAAQAAVGLSFTALNLAAAVILAALGYDPRAALFLCVFCAVLGLGALFRGRRAKSK